MARENTDNVEVKHASEQANVSESLTFTTNQTEPLDYSRSRCGGALRVAREKQGLSLNDVTNRLKISNKQLEAMEADNFIALPEPTIVKGFIRNYAKLLKLDAEPLLDAYHVLVPNKEPLAFMLKPSSSMRVDGYKKTNIARYVFSSVLLVLALVVWFFYQHYIEKPSPTAPIANIQKLENLPAQALSAREPLQQTTEITLPPANATDSLSSIETFTSPESLNVAQTATLGSSLVANTPIVDNSMIRLEFVASKETWIRVVDAKGKQIYNKNISAGGREIVEAQAPLDLVIGNAAGATVVANGKPVDLAPHTRVNVARLKLE